MKKYEMIKSKEEFSKIISSGHYKKDSFYTIYFKESETPNHFGIAISKKYGKAFERNYGKRVTRVLIDQNKKDFPNKYNYIIMIRGNVKTASFSTLSSSFTNLIKEIK